ncbi:hypothetical protein [Solibacillus sp. FSL K6-1523]|uniref:hypothetical protein n=1 Tax=Solibacillus sp. FSL K6-1523 TaxID=2921471 RepID=UPI0030F4E8E2
MKKIVVGVSLLLIATVLFSSQLIAAAIYSEWTMQIGNGVTLFWSAFFKIGSWWLISITLLIAIGGYALVMNGMKEKV